jgi:DNA-binding transcriptional regulator of glucitol operon
MDGSVREHATTYRRNVLRRISFALRPGWLVFHLVIVAAVVTMILLGRWQLRVSDEKHFSIQNFGYAIQWWLFSAFALFLWWRVVRDAYRRRAAAADATGITAAEPEPTPPSAVPYRRYVMPTTPAPSDDPVIAAYNDYLAQLAAKDAEDGRG